MKFSESLKPKSKTSKTGFQNKNNHQSKGALPEYSNVTIPSACACIPNGVRTKTSIQTKNSQVEHSKPTSPNTCTCKPNDVKSKTRIQTKNNQVEHSKPTSPNTCICKPNDVKSKTCIQTKNNQVEHSKQSSPNTCICKPNDVKSKTCIQNKNNPVEHSKPTNLSTGTCKPNGVKIRTCIQTKNNHRKPNRHWRNKKGIQSKNNQAECEYSKPASLITCACKPNGVRSKTGIQSKNNQIKVGLSEYSKPTSPNACTCEPKVAEDSENSKQSTISTDTCKRKTVYSKTCNQSKNNQSKDELSEYTTCKPKSVISENSILSNDNQNKVEVFLRIKPTNQANSIYTLKDERTLVTKAVRKGIGRDVKTTKESTYMFSHIFGPDSGQTELYNQVIRDMVLNFIDGTSGTILAYGTSGSGKTFTLIGTPQEPGIIFRALADIFVNIELEEDDSLLLQPFEYTDVYELDAELCDLVLRKKEQIFEHCDKIRQPGQKDEEVELNLDSPSKARTESAHLKCTVWVSCCEIYNEGLYDLLDCTDAPAIQSQRTPLKLSENRRGRMFCRDISLIPVRSKEEAYMLLRFGFNRLNCAATRVNEASNRSHFIFMVQLIKSDGENAKVSCLNFCDLAGSERVKNTQNVGSRLKEANYINTSLLVLRRCLEIIRKNQAITDPMKLNIVPYRESKLTKMFNKALSCHEALRIIVNMNQLPKFVKETQQSLKFSAMAQGVRLMKELCEDKQTVRVMGKISLQTLSITRMVIEQTPDTWDIDDNTSVLTSDTDIENTDFYQNNGVLNELIDVLDDNSLPTSDYINKRCTCKVNEEIHTYECFSLKKNVEPAYDKYDHISKPMEITDNMKNVNEFPSYKISSSTFDEVQDVTDSTETECKGTSSPISSSECGKSEDGLPKSNSSSSTFGKIQEERNATAVKCEDITHQEQIAYSGKNKNSMPTSASSSSKLDKKQEESNSTELECNDKSKESQVIYNRKTVNAVPISKCSNSTFDEEHEKSNFTELECNDKSKENQVIYNRKNVSAVPISKCYNSTFNEEQEESNSTELECNDKSKESQIIYNRKTVNAVPISKCSNSTFDEEHEKSNSTELECNDKSKENQVIYNRKNVSAVPISKCSNSTFDEEQEERNSTELECNDKSKESQVTYNKKNVSAVPISKCSNSTFDEEHEKSNSTELESIDKSKESQVVTYNRKNMSAVPISKCSNSTFNEEQEESNSTELEYNDKSKANQVTYNRKNVSAVPISKYYKYTFDEEQEESNSTELECNDKSKESQVTYNRKTVNAVPISKCYNYTFDEEQEESNSPELECNDKSKDNPVTYNRKNMSAIPISKCYKYTFDEEQEECNSTELECNDKSKENQVTYNRKNVSAVPISKCYKYTFDEEQEESNSTELECNDKSKENQVTYNSKNMSAVPISNCYKYTFDEEQENRNSTKFECNDKSKDDPVSYNRKNVSAIPISKCYNYTFDEEQEESNSTELECNEKSKDNQTTYNGKNVSALSISKCHSCMVDEEQEEINVKALECKDKSKLMQNTENGKKAIVELPTYVSSYPTIDEIKIEIISTIFGCNYKSISKSMQITDYRKKLTDLPTCESRPSRIDELQEERCATVPECENKTMPLRITNNEKKVIEFQTSESHTVLNEESNSAVFGNLKPKTSSFDEVQENVNSTALEYTDKSNAIKTTDIESNDVLLKCSSSTSDKELVESDYTEREGKDIPAHITGCKVKRSCMKKKLRSLFRNDENSDETDITVNGCNGKSKENDNCQNYHLCINPATDESSLHIYEEGSSISNGKQTQNQSNYHLYTNDEIMKDDISIATYDEDIVASDSYCNYFDMTTETEENSYSSVNMVETEKPKRRITLMEKPEIFRDNDESKEADDNWECSYADKQSSHSTIIYDHEKQTLVDLDTPFDNERFETESTGFKTNGSDTSMVTPYMGTVSTQTQEKIVCKSRSTQTLSKETRNKEEDTNDKCLRCVLM